MVLCNKNSKNLRIPEHSHWNVFIVCLAVLFVGNLALLNNQTTRPLLKFCFNSRDQFVSAQCVLCDFYKFSATVLGCNGRTSALMSNITSTEAVCIISNCLQQVRQSQPQFTGRKRRDAMNNSFLSNDKTETTTEMNFENLDIIDVRKELDAVSPSIKELLNQYVKLDEKLMKELEDQVVDKIEVSVDDIDDDYDE